MERVNLLGTQLEERCKGQVGATVSLDWVITYHRCYLNEGHDQPCTITFGHEAYEAYRRRTERPVPKSHEEQMEELAHVRRQMLHGVAIY